MEFVLGLVDLELPNSSGCYALRDPAQGPALDEALKLTQPSLRKGSKRTRGEEQQAEEERRERETAPPGGEGVERREVARAAGKRRATVRVPYRE